MKKRILAAALVVLMALGDVGYALAGDTAAAETNTAAGQTESSQGTEEAGDSAAAETKPETQTAQESAAETETKSAAQTESGAQTESAAGAQGVTETAAETKAAAEKTVWKSGYAEMIQSGDLVAEHFDAGAAGTASAQSKSLRRSASYTRPEAIAALKPIFAEAFANCESVVDVSAFDLYVRDSGDTEALDGVDIITEAYQTAVTGEDFYITGKFDYGYGENSGQITKVSIGYGSSFSRSTVSSGTLPDPDTDAIKSAQSRFSAAVSEALAAAGEGSTDLEKALLLHDYIVTQCSYDYGGIQAVGEYPDDDYTAYGVLVKHKAVCNGYAFAYSWLLQQCGIESYIMASETMDHAWNLVKLDNNWYHVDTTRDDRLFTKGLTYFSLGNSDAADEGYVSHKYFLRSDSEMKSYGYKYWAIQASSDTIPEAGDSSSLSGYIFRAYPDGALMKTGGSWYLGSLGDRKIYSLTGLDSGPSGTAYAADDLMYAVSSGSLIYFNRKGGIYTLDPSSGTVSAVMQTADQSQTVSEMVVKGGKLVYVVLDQNGADREYSQDISSLKANAMPAAVSLKSAQAGEKGITLKWDAGTSADGYILYVCGSSSGSFTKLAEISGAGNVSYCYQPGDLNRRWYMIRTYRKCGGTYVYSEYSAAVSGQMDNGWMVFPDGTKKYFADGKNMTGRQKISGSWYYFDKTSSLMKYGWVTDGGYRYYFSKSSGKALTGWQVIGKKGYYFNSSTAAAYTGWHRFSRRRYYFSKSGVLKKTPGKVLTGGYFFSKKGVPQTGWKWVGSGEYYFSSTDHKRITGLNKIGRYKYCFNSAGVMRTGWVSAAGGGRRYFSRRTGRMLTGWRTISGRKYYFKKSTGIQLTGLRTVGRYKYYFYRSGGLARGLVKISGKRYFFRQNGRLDTGWAESKSGGMQYLAGGRPVKGLQTIDGLEFYFDSSGCLRTGLVNIAGKTYYFKSTGGMIRDEYITLTNGDGTRKIAYFDENGVRVTGLKNVSGRTYYLVANDSRLSSQEKREIIVTMALTYLKAAKGSSRHYQLITTYNSIDSSLKVGYTMSYADAWCAAAVSAWGSLTGMTSAVLPECSCPRMINLYRNRGQWVENDAYVPKIGDIVMYDWEDTGYGDDKGVADHVGIVTEVFAASGRQYFRVIEGNCIFNINTGNTISAAEKAAGKNLDNVTYFRGVGIRTMQVNGRYIRGFCTPSY